MIVYKTTNIINNKIYIGQSIKNDPNYLGSGKYFLRAVYKYGRKNFKKEILVKVNNRELLDDLEKHYIQLYASHVVGYNLQLGGRGNKLRKDDYKQMPLGIEYKPLSKKEFHNLPENKKIYRERALKMITEGKHVFSKLSQDEIKEQAKKASNFALLVTRKPMSIIDTFTGEQIYFQSVKEAMLFFNTKSSVNLNKNFKKGTLYKKRYKILK